MTALLMLTMHVYASYTVRIITDKVLPIEKLYLIGINGNWNIGGEDSKEMTVVEQDETTKTWSYTRADVHDFKVVINHRNWDNIYSTSNISFVADDPASDDKVMTFTLEYATINVLAPECTDKVYLIGGWNDKKDWKEAESKSIECVSAGTDPDSGRPMFTGYIIRNYNANFKCYNRAGTWAYEEALNDSGDNTEQHTGQPGQTTNITVNYWKQKAYTCPENIGDVTLTITAPEGTDKVYLVGEGDAFAHNWYLSEAIECTHVSGNTFTHTFENIKSVTYKCYNRISWNDHDSWHFEEKTAGGESVSNRTLSFSNGAAQSITVENWENKGYEQRDVTITITNVPKCTDQVWLRGGWLTDDWGASAHTIQAVQQPDGSFVATVRTVDGKHFKCYNRSDDWETVEYNGSGAAIEQRTTSGTSMSISVAEWEKRAYTCSGDITVTITTPPGTEEVYLAGNWEHSWWLSEAVQCTKTADRTFTYTFENVSSVQFKCLNKNTAVNNEWVYEERKADGSALDANRSINFFDAEAYDFTVEKWRSPYQVGYSDQMSNAATSTFYNDQTVDVVLTGRTLTSASYNTLCLPFELATLTGTPLEGADLKALDRTEQVGDELQLYFADATSITAGKPYLVQPTSSLVEPVFEGVFISNDVVASYDEATGIRFQGILNPTHLPSTRNILFLGADNELFWPSDDGTSMPGMRAYFQLDGGPSSAPIRRVRIVQAPQTVTELESIPTPIKSQKMIENGVLLIQRDGVKYDVLGQQVR